MDSKGNLDREYIPDQIKVSELVDLFWNKEDIAKAEELKPIDRNEELELSIEATVDALFYDLCIAPAKIYYRQVEYFTHRIAIWKPHPSFNILISHLSEKVKDELDKRVDTPKIFNYIVESAVERLFMSINKSVYFTYVKPYLHVKMVSH